MDIPGVAELLELIRRLEAEGKARMAEKRDKAAHRCAVA